MNRDRAPTTNSADRLAESELRFRTLFEQAPFSVQLLAVDGRTLKVNKAWEELWGMTNDVSLKNYVLTEYNMLADPQLRAKGVTPYLERAFAGESVEIPAIIYDPAEIGKTGRARWVKAQAHPIKDEDGRVREIMLIHEDVSERMQNENALRANETRLKQLANTIPQLAWITDATGWVHWYNNRWYDYTGTTPEEMEGWGWQRVCDPEAMPRIMEQWRRSLATGEPFQTTFPLRGKDGVFRTFFSLAEPLKDEQGNVVQWFGTNTDVSSLEKAEEELRKAEERLRLATDAGNIGIWEWDIAQDKVTWSERLYPLHGLEPGAFGGTSAAFSDLVHPDDLQEMWDKISAAIKADGQFSAEFRAVLPDGSVRWLSTWARAHADADGKVDRLVGATISIDAYKRAETALKESDRRKDEFLAMLAHELRNPLAPVSTAAQLLKLSFNDESRVRQFSDIIARQVKHMTELVDDLLDVSRVTRGLVQLQKETLDLKSVISSAIEQARPLIESRHHVLATWMDAERLYVYGDRTRLVQVFVNLLNNAAKYTPQRGEIALRVQVENARVQIYIKDNGLGIDAGLLPHIFDLFTQAARTPDRSQGGLGIGLALVKSMVGLHDGQVEACSDGPGRGSTFIVSLPLIKAAAGMPVRDDNEGFAASGAPLHVMIVDDNVDAAQSLAALLETAGHRIDVRNDAMSALDAAEKDPPQVFILDIGLPGMDGYELAKRLRKQSGSANATMIALTGYGQAHDLHYSKEAGFDHHFVKPVDTPKLMAILARVPK